MVTVPDHRIDNPGAKGTLGALVQKRATRYWIERCFQDAKTSLAWPIIRSAGGWHHHLALVMVAMLFVVPERKRNEPTV